MSITVVENVPQTLYFLGDQINWSPTNKMHIKKNSKKLLNHICLKLLWHLCI